MSSHSSQPTITAAELPFPALTAGRYRDGQLTRVVHQPYLVPSTVARIVDQLRASTGQPDGDRVLALADA